MNRCALHETCDVGHGICRRAALRLRNSALLSLDADVEEALRDLAHEFGVTCSHIDADGVTID
jgi:hypothetical protein